MKKILLSLLAALALIGAAGGARASEGGYAWDKFPEQKTIDVASLQNGAKLFVNYCIGCHSAAFMRYNRMNDIGLSDEVIKKNLLFTTDKVGETMKAAIDPRQAKAWFGTNPPDLSVIARSRAGSGGSGADYLYTYLRNYYRDDTKPTGWNNMVYPNVAMPNPLWELQGQRIAKFVEEKNPHEEGQVTHRFEGFETTSKGTLSEHDFDEAVADIVAYMQWMGEPAQHTRTRIGVWVLLFLAVFTVIAWRLNAAFWKDVK